MEFFDDPSEIDDRIDELEYYIGCGDWEEVSSYIDIFILIIKEQLWKMHDENNPKGYCLVAMCKSASDVLDTKRHLNVNIAEFFSCCLLAVYRIKGILSWGSLSDGDRDEIKFQVGRLKQNLYKVLPTTQNFRHRAGKHGSDGTRRKMFDRIEKIKKELLETYNPDTLRSFIVTKNQFEEIAAKCNDNIHMSHPTLKKYRDKIENDLKNNDMTVKFK